HAKRESVSQGRNGAYRIVVPADEFGRAVDIASASALAEDDGAALESLAAGRGFIPPTAEEASFRVRFREALELERVVRAIPGVVRARALVRLTKPAEGARESGPTRTVHLVVSFDSAAVARDELDRQIATVVPQAGDAKLIVSLLPMADAADGTALSAPATVRLGFPFSFDVLASQTKRVQAQLYALIGGAIVSALMVGLSFGFHLARRRRRTRSGDSKATDRSRATGSFELPEGSRRAGGEPVAGNES
ncbi:MAG: hypothetical protein IT290_10350, partial [Deltaproteobacteria bacterium]|nr:hypothetical protein [Deltaproteobacteria bacterium]